MSAEVKTISCEEVARQQASGEALFLLDVREPHEALICQIPGSTLIPLGEIPARLGELPVQARIVAYCHHGRRSERAIQYLQLHGFAELYNLTGGIDEWAVQIDPGMARY